MCSTFETIKKAMDIRKQADELYRESNQILSRGPSTFYFEMLEGYVNYLFNEALPLKVGDRVELVDNIDAQGAWYHCRHFLIKGGKGVVADVDIYKGKAWCSVVFDDESWIDSTGKVQLYRPDEKHTFSIEMKKFNKLTQK